MEKLKQTQKRPDTSRASHLLARKVVPRAYEQISDRAMVNQISAVCFVCVVCVDCLCCPASDTYGYGMIVAYVRCG